MAKVGSPIAILTALLFYFGWSRAESQARALGYDVTLLGLSTSDFVLRSINVLFLPVVILLVLGLIITTMHCILIRNLDRWREHRATEGLLWSLRHAWILFLVLGTILAATVPPLRSTALPLALMTGIAISIYGDRLDRLLHEKPKADRLVNTLVILLLAVAVFWGTERVANAFGTEFAGYVAATPEDYVPITIVSQRRLELAMPTIDEQQVGNEDSSYRYRYDGFRLLIYSNRKYFLLAYPAPGQAMRVVVLPDTDQIRVEFSR